MKYADERAPQERRLYPDDPPKRREIEVFEEKVAHRFGIEGRRLMYWHFFRWGRPALRFNEGTSPKWQRLAMAWFFPVSQRLIERALNVNDATAARSVERIAPFIEEVNAQLSDGRPYLFGDTFTAADLTFSALAAPLVLPVGYGVTLPTLDEVPGHIQEVVNGYRGTPAGQHAMRMYAQHRR